MELICNAPRRQKTAPMRRLADTYFFNYLRVVLTPKFVVFQKYIYKIIRKRTGMIV